MKEPYCIRCGKPLSKETQELCENCCNTERYFDAGRCVYRYDSDISRSIKEFKSIGTREYADFYAFSMYQKYKDFIETSGAGAIVPVPIHKSKLNVRGFNQAELIAVELSKYTGIPVMNILEKPVKTTDQKDLDKKNRMRNLYSAFKVHRKFNRQDIPSGVILIDDIFTTGSTMNACSRVLREAGVKKIYFMCVAAGAAE